MLYVGYMGIMDKTMETIVILGYIGFRVNAKAKF